MRDLKKIGKMLEDARKEKGVSREEVSKRTRIHSTVIVELEEGTAEKRLSKIYIKGFMKKYAAFLGVNLSEEELKDYRKETKQKLHIDPTEPKEIDVTKYATYVAMAFTGILLISVLIFGITRIGQFVGARVARREKTTAGIDSRKKPLPRKTLPKKEPVKKEVKKEKKESIFSFKKSFLPTPQKVSLTLKTSDKVWVRVEENGNTVYEGVLDPNARESWMADAELKLRVGKLEALEFTVNGKELGALGYGVENIVVNKKGIKIGTKTFHSTE